MSVFDSSYLDEHQLRDMGFADVGNNVRIDSKCTILGREFIRIGSNVRIDGYCTIIASNIGVQIGSYVHIAGQCLLSGGAGIVLSDFSGLSHGVKIYSKSDDYSGKFLTNPTVPTTLTNVKSGRVLLERHAIVGSGSVVLPGVTLGEGAAVGALSLVTKSLQGWGIYSGTPARFVKKRSSTLLELERELTF